MVEWEKKTARVSGRTVCYNLEFNNHLSFSKSDRFLLQFASYCVTYPSAELKR